jgi:uncharacterized protein YciI
MLPGSLRFSLPVLACCALIGEPRLTAQAPPAPAAPAPPAAAAMMSAPMYLVIYQPGPGWKPGVSDAEQLREHGRYMFTLHLKKVLRMGGPFPGASGGAAVIDADNLAAAQAIVDADPAVVSKVFVAEVRAWSHVNWDELAKRLAPKPAAQP